MKISLELSSKFANMGFVCVCLVVLMHVHCPWEGGGINQLAVPFFFLMSGYFLAGHVDESGWYRLAVRKRLRTLLIPLFIWCALWSVYTMPLAVFLNARAGRPLTAHLLTGWGILRYLALDITHTPALGPLWYVRCLFVFVLVSPLLVLLVRKLRLGSLILPGAMYAAYVMYGERIDFFSYGFSLEGLFYFTAGLYLRISSRSLNVSILSGALMLAAGLAAYYFGFIDLSIPLMIVGLWGVMPSRSLPKFLTGNTFPVYLIHMFVLLLFGSNKIDSPVLAISVGFAVIAISVALSAMIRKCMPCTAAIVFGGR